MMTRFSHFLTKEETKPPLSIVRVQMRVRYPGEHRRLYLKTKKCSEVRSPHPDDGKHNVVYIPFMLQDSSSIWIVGIFPPRISYRAFFDAKWPQKWSITPHFPSRRDNTNEELTKLIFMSIDSAKHATKKTSGDKTHLLKSECNTK